MDTHRNVCYLVLYPAVLSIQLYLVITKSYLTRKYIRYKHIFATHYYWREIFVYFIISDNSLYTCSLYRGLTVFLLFCVHYFSGKHVLQKFWLERKCIPTKAPDSLQVKGLLDENSKEPLRTCETCLTVKKTCLSFSHCRFFLEE